MGKWYRTDTEDFGPQPPTHHVTTLDGKRGDGYTVEGAFSDLVTRELLERHAQDVLLGTVLAADVNALITEDWLKAVGFKWHQFDRQPSKHWLLWLGDVMNGGGFGSFEDIGVELAAGAYNFQRGDSTDWFCWLRGDSSHRYCRFIHVRHMREQRELIRLVEGLTDQDWNPANHLYGSCRTPQAAERIRREDAARIDRLENWRQRPTWSEVEKDDTRGRALPEHMEVAEKTRGAI